jgi:thiol-disulfide isomerase/thioredoxin
MTPEELKEKVANTPGIVLYFKNDLCSPCLALRPKIEELVNIQFPKMEFLIVDTVQQPLLSSEYQVFANPTILVFFEGREYIRKSKYIGTSELEQDISRLYTMVFSD